MTDFSGIPIRSNDDNNEIRSEWFNSIRQRLVNFETAPDFPEYANEAAFVTAKGSAAAQADYFYDTTEDRLKVHDGTKWTTAVMQEDNVTFEGNVTISGNLQVDGSTSTINSTTLEVTDANIIVNNGGNQSNADTNDAGITVEMSDATDALVHYDSTATSKFKAGESGSTAEIATISHTQTLTNKTLTSPDIDTPDINGGTASNTSRIILPKDTTTNLDALTDTQALIAYDTTLDTVVANDGTGWNQISGGGGGLDKWVSGTTYAIDDVVWYDTDDKIYVCTTGNSDVSFTPGNWQELSAGVTDHTNLTNIGTNTHAQIDTTLAANTAAIANKHLDEFYAQNFEGFTTGDILESGNNATFSGGGTIDGTIAMETTNEISGTQSLKYTASTASTNDYFEIESITLSDKQTGQTVGLNVWVDMTNFSVDADLVIWDLTNAAKISTEQMVVKGGKALTCYKNVVNIPSTCTSISYGLHMTTGPVNTEFILIDDAEFKNNPMSTHQSLESDSVRYTGYTGVGSTNNKIPYFANEETVPAGDIITVSNSSTNGFSITANAEILLTVTFSSVYTAGAFFGLTLNCSELTTGIDSLGDDSVICAISSTDSSGAAEAVSATIKMKSGDVIRPHIASGSFSATEKWTLTATAQATSSNVVFQSENTSQQEWQDYTPTTQGFGTITNDAVKEKRVGDSLEISGYFDCGTPTATEAQIGLPSNLQVLSGVTRFHVGEIWNETSGSTPLPLIATGGDTFVNIGRIDTTNFTEGNGSDFYGAGARVMFKVLVPIEGWGATDIISIPVTNDVENVYSARIANNGTATITSQSASFIESVNRSSLGIVDIVFKTGFFTVAPSVVPSQEVNGDVDVSHTSLSTTGVTIRCKTSGGAYSDLDFNIVVQRQGADYKAPKGYFLGNLSMPVATIKDVKASGTAGGTFTSGAWQTRTLNTLDDSFGIGITLSSNQFTLPAGTYEIDADAPGFNVNDHQAKLRNITDTADDILGSSAFTNSANQVTTLSLIKGIVKIDSSKTFEIQHRCTTTRATDGWGNAAGFGVNEIYTQVKITKLR